MEYETGSFSGSTAYEIIRIRELISNYLWFVQFSRDRERETYGYSGNRRIDRSTLANLYLVDGLLENRTPRIRSRNDIYLDDSLRIFATLVRGLNGYAVLFSCIKLPHRFDNTSFRIYFELVESVVGHVINTIRYLGVLTLVVVSRLYLYLRFLSINERRNLS